VYINPAHFLALPPNGDFTGGVPVVNRDKPAIADGIYDLQGVRLDEIPVRGLYIQNGKKIFRN
jgi:hypothetical protein